MNSSNTFNHKSLATFALGLRVVVPKALSDYISLTTLRTPCRECICLCFIDSASGLSSHPPWGIYHISEAFMAPQGKCSCQLDIPMGEEYSRQKQEHSGKVVIWGKSLKQIFMFTHFRDANICTASSFKHLKVYGSKYILSGCLRIDFPVEF